MPHRSWGAHCSGRIQTVVLSNGVKLPVRSEIAELVGLLCEETMRRGYRLVPGWCWGYACRKIRGSSSWSNHAWGLAVDLNAPKNPMTNRLITDMPAWMPTLWKSYGFRWGGEYRGRPDAMHYEFMGSVTDARNQTERARRELRPGAAKSTPERLTHGQLKWLAQAVGIGEDELSLAAAVAYGESGGNPRAFNGKAPDASYGLWQINMHGILGPARRKEFGLSSNEDLFDPLTNARAMKAIRRGQGWDAWGAFTNQSYLRHLPAALEARPTPIPNVRKDDDVLRIITTLNSDGSKAGVFVESNLSMVKWVPNPDAWNVAKRYATEGADDPVVVPRDQFDLLEKIGTDIGQWPK